MTNKIENIARLPLAVPESEKDKSIRNFGGTDLYRKRLVNSLLLSIVLVFGMVSTGFHGIFSPSSQTL